MPETEPGVWIVAESVPFEGILRALPFATEIDALRAINSGEIVGSPRAYFVPFGQDLREVMG